MAEIGKGDPRWIVEHREDGHNVNSWHWEEKDRSKWGKEKMKEMFDGLVIVNEGGMRIRVTEVDTLKGDAALHRRKGKLIGVFEWELKINWEGEVIDGDGNAVSTVKGSAEIPEVTNFDEDEDDFEVRINVTKGDNSLIRNAMKQKYKSIVFEKMQKFLTELKETAGGSQNDSSPAKPAAAQPTQPKPKALPQQEVKKEVKDTRFTNISMTEKFQCRAEDLFEALMDEGRVSAFTGSAAKVSRDVGGSFSMFNGSVVGENKEIVANSKIVQKWRFNSWDTDYFSTVTINLSFDDGTTTLKLKHEGVPASDKERTEQGWKNMFWNRIRQVFHFGPSSGNIF